MDPKLAITLRTKKLGILIRGTRLAAGKTMKECGQVIGVSSASMSSIELGRRSLSLPELELLANYLNAPLEQFWQDAIISEEDPQITEESHVELALVMRDRSIGKILEDARINARQTYKQIREHTGISPSRMNRYENGEAPIPIPELELLINLLGLTIQQFIDPDTEVGQWIIAQSSVEGFLKLSPETQTFVITPVNQPYIELARKLSTLSADELRAVAEGLLEITI